MQTQNYLSVYAKSFSWAGFFLPKNILIKCSVLYDFCRTLDNIADQNNSLEKKKEEFIKFKEEFSSKSKNNIIISNMIDLIRSENINSSIVYDLFDGIESDIKANVKIKSYKELLLYCYRVAGTVGLMMAKIMKVKNRDSLKSAINLGIAMQLTNISRDVIEDKNNDREYIEANLLILKNTIHKADNFYESSFYAIRDIPLICRFSIIVARRVYREIGRKILKISDFENYKCSGKVYLNNFEKLIQTFFSLGDIFKLMFTTKNTNLTIIDHSLINEDINLNERF
ncbi:MAG: phytoene synthase [Candidatus Pelagibacter sp.]|nr:phytoene synthase [Candidatus Pelagibacter sp.]|tara:strand:- start:17386 stop:18237 length:852 start_codon:yes stop_codon:yes gene_type:complete